MQKPLTKLIMSSMYLGLISVLAFAPFSGMNAQNQNSSSQSGSGSSEKLTQPVDLPNLPQYSGDSKFIRGSQSSNNVGISYELLYDSKDPQEQIADWYQNTLKNNNWCVKRTAADRMSATHRDGHWCIITTSAPEQPEHPKKQNRVQSNFTIHYVARIRK